MGFFGDLTKVGKSVLDSNKAISGLNLESRWKVGKKAARSTLEKMVNGKNLEKYTGGAVTPVKQEMSWLDGAESLLYDEKGDFSYGRAAAAGLTTYGALNVPYRLISGGGLTYDNNGNTDIIGVPFI